MIIVKSVDRVVVAKVGKIEKARKHIKSYDGNK